MLSSEWVVVDCSLILASAKSLSRTPATILPTSIFLRAVPFAMLPHTQTMTPETITAARKASKRERYVPPKGKDLPAFPPELEPEADDAEAGALQPVSAPEADWEGFGTEGEDKESEENYSSSSEDDEEEDNEEDQTEPEIVIEKKKKEKIVLPKDAEEEELERMVFGDSAGFKEGIDGFSLDQSAGRFAQDSSDEQDDDADLEDTADQDLFFFDAGPTAAPAASSMAVAKGEASEDEDDKPAWEDSDDERLVVSLATVPQLRKLRENAGDDIVSGKEYVRRLRVQYERLYSTPEWVMQASGKSKRKRQHAAEDGESDAESASDMDVDDEDLSTQPLAALLKSADILSKGSRGPSKRRKLQSGTVDIQRLKDVAGPGPVRFSATKFWPALTHFLVRNHLPFVSFHIPIVALIRA